VFRKIKVCDICGAHELNEPIYDVKVIYGAPYNPIYSHHLCSNCFQNGVEYVTTFTNWREMEKRRRTLERNRGRQSFRLTYDTSGPRRTNNTF